MGDPAVIANQPEYQSSIAVAATERAVELYHAMVKLEQQIQDSEPFERFDEEMREMAKRIALFREALAALEEELKLEWSKDPNDLKIASWKSVGNGGDEPLCSRKNSAVCICVMSKNGAIRWK
jgi:protein subunit release factor A